MGCDVHAAIEVLESFAESHTWRSFTGELDIKRDYTLFGCLAGVRLRDIDHFEPRGHPLGIGDSTLEMLDGCHSCSWLTTEELASVARKYHETEHSSARTRKELEAIVRMMRVFEPGARFVFGFDN